MSLVAVIFCPVYSCVLQTSSKTPSERTDHRQLNTSCVKTHFLALIVVDSINLSSENSCRKQLDSSVEALSYFKFSIFSGELPCVVNLVISKPSEPNTPIHAVRNTSDSRVCLVAAWNMTNKKQDAKPSFGSMHLLLRTSPSPTCVRASCNVSSSK